MSDFQTLVESPKRKLQRELTESVNLQEAAGASTAPVEHEPVAVTPMDVLDRAGSDRSNAFRSQHINELAMALSRAQGVMENAPMNRINPHFKSKYADLASVLSSTRGPLSANGLAVIQSTEIRESGMVLRTQLMHESGQWLASEYPLPATARPQEMGSALTYARRYSYAAMVCNSADEDDDAEGAENGKQRIEAKGKAPAALVKHDEKTGEIANDSIPPALDRRLITDQQNQQLQARIANLGVDIAMFCDLMRVKKIAELNTRDLPEAVRHLDEFEAYQKAEAARHLDEFQAYQKKASGKK